MTKPNRDITKCETCGRTSEVVDMDKCPFCQPNRDITAEILKEFDDIIVDASENYERIMDEKGWRTDTEGSRASKRYWLEVFIRMKERVQEIL